MMVVLILPIEFALFVFFLIMELTFVLQPIYQKKNFLWKRLKSLQNEMERGNKFSGTENIRLVSSTGTVSKYDGILQEINARMILYNFCELVIAHAVVKTRDNTKHTYKINFATAVNICRAYLKQGSDEIKTMLLIQNHLTPVRCNRKYPINLRPKRNRDFMYRAA